jgi:hypothetical protein
VVLYEVCSLCKEFGAFRETKISQKKYFLSCGLFNVVPSCLQTYNIALLSHESVLCDKLLIFKITIPGKLNTVELGYKVMKGTEYFVSL